MEYPEFFRLANSTYDEIVKYRRASSEFNSENLVALKAFMTCLLSYYCRNPQQCQKLTTTGPRRMHWFCSIQGDWNDEKRRAESVASEIRHIQSNFALSIRNQSLEDATRVFSKLVMEGKLSPAVKFIENESSTRCLSLFRKSFGGKGEAPLTCSSRRRQFTLGSNRSRGIPLEKILEKSQKNHRKFTKIHHNQKKSAQEQFCLVTSQYKVH